jgi:hypothetical protein
MADDAPEGPTEATKSSAPAPPDDGERAGDFERYALIAALTLVVLCLLVWDRWRARDPAASAPPPDRSLHVELGGDAPASTSRPPAPRSDVPRAPSDPPPAAPPATPPAPELRRYVVQGGDTLYEIARRELGSSKRAQEIADLNGLADPSKLREGQTLKIPAR